MSKFGEFLRRLQRRVAERAIARFAHSAEVRALNDKIDRLERELMRERQKLGWEQGEVARLRLLCQALRLSVRPSLWQRARNGRDDAAPAVEVSAPDCADRGSLASAVRPLRARARPVVELFPSNGRLNVGGVE